MSVLEKIGYYLNRRDEVPNQELARELTEKEDTGGIKEIAENLENKNRSIAGDCIKVMYEIGYIKPELIADYVISFLELLSSKQNRMVWGGMIALSTIAKLKPGELWAHRGLLEETISRGTVITEVAGIKALARLAEVKPLYNRALTPFLFTALEDCRAVDFATRMETLYPMVTRATRTDFFRIIEEKKPLLKEAQLKKVNRLLRKWEKEE